MNETDAREEMEKIYSVVATAKRLVGEGRLIDLSAMPARVQAICATISALPAEQGKLLAPLLERLISHLDDLAGELTARHRADLATPAQAGAAYRRSPAKEKR
jgi:hypothetical protein